MGDRIAILREGGVLAQYDTPKEILARPADDFVAQFVGADRGIKRLVADDARRARAALARRPQRRARQLPADGDASRTRSRCCSPSPRRTARRARRRRMRVTGLLTLSHLERLIAQDADGDASAVDSRPAPAPAGSARGGGPVIGSLAAAGGPVIPNFSEHSSSCAVQNKLFCSTGSNRTGARCCGPRCASTSCLTADRRRDRLRDLDGAGAVRAPPPLGRTADVARHDVPLHDPLAGAVRAARGAGRQNIYAAEIALVSYTLLILFRNILTGLRSVPPDVREAAEGMGMTPRQSLLQHRAAAGAAVDHRRPAHRGR